MVKTITRKLIKNKANNQYSVTLPKKQLFPNLGKRNLTDFPDKKEPKKIKLKVEDILY